MIDEGSAGVAVLIEDNLMFAMMIEPALRKIGYRTHTLTGDSNAVEQTVALGPGVILVNLTSTRFSGPELVRSLKERPELNGVGVVGYAGHVERRFFEEGRAAGADLVVPNSAIRKALPEVLDTLRRRITGAEVEEWLVEEA